MEQNNDVSLIEKNATSKQEFEVYTNAFLKIYDYFVLSFICPLIWGCSKQKILNHYNQCITGNHLDMGVGTGYFLDRCHFPTAKPHICLLDLNENCLRVTKERIARYQPHIFIGDVLQELPAFGTKFDSVGINYLLHCLPGTIYDKANVFEHINAHLNPNATVFGATVLSKGIKLNPLAKRLMHIYNKYGIFFNANDSFDGLQNILNQHYNEVKVTLSGCIALFSGKKVS